MAGRADEAKSKETRVHNIGPARFREPLIGKQDSVRMRDLHAGDCGRLVGGYYLLLRFTAYPASTVSGWEPLVRHSKKFAQGRRSPSLH